MKKFMTVIVASFALFIGISGVKASANYMMEGHLSGLSTTITKVRPGEEFYVYVSVAPNSNTIQVYSPLHRVLQLQLKL